MYSQLAPKLWGVLWVVVWLLKVKLGLIVTVRCTTLLERQEHECLWNKEFEQEIPVLEQND
jgi:hypothetical protein